MRNKKLEVRNKKVNGHAPSSFLIPYFLFLLLAPAQSFQQNICINQVGFYPSAQKIAVVKGATTSDHFYIISKQTNDTVF